MFGVFVHPEHDFSETLTNRREFQTTMISFHEFLQNSDERINKHAYIFRLNENKYVSKYILNQSINIEEYKQQELKEDSQIFQNTQNDCKETSVQCYMLENSSSMFFIKYYLKILGLKITCSVDELLVNTHCDTVQECLSSAEDNTLISTAII